MSLTQMRQLSPRENCLKKEKPSPSRQKSYSHKIWVPADSGIPLRRRARHPLPESTRCAKSVDFSIRWLTALFQVLNVFIQIPFQGVFSLFQGFDVFLEAYTYCGFAERHH